MSRLLRTAGSRVSTGTAHQRLRAAAWAPTAEHSSANFECTCDFKYSLPRCTLAHVSLLPWARKRDDTVFSASASQSPLDPIADVTDQRRGPSRFRYEMSKAQMSGGENYDLPTLRTRATG